jgi:hypothetical protein
MKIMANHHFRPNDKRHRAWCNQTTFAEDGCVIMNPRDNFEHVAKSVVNVALTMLQQLPNHYDVKVDVPQFLNSITMKDGDHRVGPGNWELGPGWRASNSPLPAQTLTDNTIPDSDRAQAISRYRTYYEKVAKFIPFAVQNNRHKYQPFELQEGENVDTRTRGRPAHKKKGKCHICNGLFNLTL